MSDQELELPLTKQAAVVVIARTTTGSRMLRRLLAFDGRKVGRRHV